MIHLAIEFPAQVRAHPPDQVMPGQVRGVQGAGAADDE
jgi:hypothetical protein